MRFSVRVWSRGICQVVKTQCLWKATELRAPKIYLALLCSEGVLSFSRRDQRDPSETLTSTPLVLIRRHWMPALQFPSDYQGSLLLYSHSPSNRDHCQGKMRSGKRIKKGRKDRPSIAINEFTYSLTNGYGMLAIFQRLCWSRRYRWIRNSLDFED